MSRQNHGEQNEEQEQTVLVGDESGVGQSSQRSESMAAASF